ncbi:asparaginase [uncultured Megasphaera sp.]|uniref:asparaginase n=1 Tax=Megasphaera massiliensis TaxID=1232428 RepID=UPI00266B8801|nr:asparaginase [uncultured Megasphaera sp.]
MMGKRKIYVLACGGTIAGKAASADDLTGYEAGKTSIGELLDAVPAIHDYADVKGEQFVNIDSSDMTEALWQALASRVQEVAEREDVDGIVITHGTDTMEETAYYLNLTVHTRKPVVLTGSMRPATAISADGPLNLLEAVQAAADAELGDCGVVIVMNSVIHSARFVEKTDTTHVDTFKARQLGCLGYMQDGRVRLYQKPLRQHTFSSDFVSPLTLPAVAVVYAYVGLRAEDVVQLARGKEGLVMAGLGHGKMPAPVWTALQPLMKEGLVVVRSARSLGGLVTPVPSYDGTVTADSLTPQKAKILLQLALCRTKELSEIQAFFDAY